MSLDKGHLNPSACLRLLGLGLKNHIPKLSLISAGLMHPKAFGEFISDSKVTPVEAHVTKGT